MPWQRLLLCHCRRLMQLGLGLGVGLVLAACGGGSGSTTASSPPLVAFPASAASLNDSNVAAITVEAGPGRNVNIPYVSVRVCQPGSTIHCQTIDKVLLDTGSTGLRLFASQITVSLPPHQVGASSTISQCAQFLNMQAWGTVKQADVYMGGRALDGERASSVPIQLMDANYASVPSVCGSAPLTSTTTTASTEALNANGILGAGLYDNDGQIYFNCATPNSSCPAISVAPSLQVRNPVGLFARNNNGVTVQLPAISSSGETGAQGYLIFGVGTQGNNLMGSAQVVPLNTTGRSRGFFDTVYGGATLRGFLDTGSNGLYFNDTALQSPACTSASAGFYCPASTQDLTATVRLASSTLPVSFSIANADNLFASRSRYAFNNLGGSIASDFFGWGLPFYFGRTVHTVIEGKSANTGAGIATGPFNAFTN